MRSFVISALSLLCLALWTPVTLTAQERDRSKIPDQYKWDLTDVYPSDEAWKEAKEKFIEELPAIEKYQGTLNMSTDRLWGCLDLFWQLNKEFARLFTYVNLILDQDMRVQSYSALQQEVDQLGATFGEESAFIEPEILAIDPAVVKSFLTSDRRLDTYRHYLERHSPPQGAHRYCGRRENHRRRGIDGGRASEHPRHVYQRRFSVPGSGAK